MKSLNFANWCKMGKVQKVPKVDSQSQFSTSNLSHFFSFKTTNLEAYFLLWTFFDNINLLITLFSKMIPNLSQLATTPILKIQYFHVITVDF